MVEKGEFKVKSGKIKDKISHQMVENKRNAFLLKKHIKKYELKEKS